MHYKLLLTVATLFLVAGCQSKGTCSFAGCGPDSPVGGTGGGGAGGNVAINQDNFVTILREAWFAANSTSDLPFFVVATGIGGDDGIPGVIFFRGF